jgi:hypothetical protein
MKSVVSLIGLSRFRWVTLQVAALCNQDEIKTSKDVKDRLGKLPRDLHKLYDEIYERIKKMAPNSFSVAQTILKWLLYAQRQLSPDELVAAASIVGSTSVTLSTVLDLCCNLVTLDQKSNSFIFAHLSVREYMETREEYKPYVGHGTIAKFCLERFIDDESSQSNKLLEYASLYWPRHYEKAAENGRRSEEVVEVARAFLWNTKSSKGISMWSSHGKDVIKSMPWSGDLRDRLQDASFEPFKTICVWGFTDLLDHYINSEQQYSLYKTITLGLSLTVKWRNGAMTRILLEKLVELGNVKLNLHVPFLLACHQNLKEIANTMMRYESAFRIGGDARWTLLHWMIIQKNKPGVAYLLENGAECSQKDVDGRTPLHFAAMNGYQYGVQQLLECGAQVDTADKASWTPWHWAAFMGNNAQSQLPTSSQDTNVDFSRSSFLSRLVSRLTRDV